MRETLTRSPARGKLWAALALGMAAAGVPLACLRKRPAIPRGTVAAWPVYGGDASGSRYSLADQVTRENVRLLERAWVYRTGEMDSAWSTANATSLEVTPLVVDNTLYLSTPLGRVIALDPELGAERWVFDPKLDRTVDYGDFINRGVSTWLDSTRAATQLCRRRIFVAPIDGRLIALDAHKGELCVDFGDSGTVNLRSGVRNPPADWADYEITSPPAVVNGVVVVGSAVADNGRIDMPGGVVRAFDARNGMLRWSWEPVPQDPADPAWKTWLGPRAHNAGAANAWSVMTADPERDLVFVPTGSASPDYYGGERLGENRYANSVVALRVSTGKVAWHFQVVHHDLWDYDVASPPALVTVRRDGIDVPAVAQATKMGHFFLLHRETGVPLFPVEERAVPRSSVPGEEAFPTQPFPTVVAPLVPQGIGPNDAWGMTPGERAYCRRRLESLVTGPVFTPPSLQGTAVFPGNIGGAHWGGLAFDRERGLALINTNRLAAVITLIPREGFDWSVADTSDAEFAAMEGTPYVLRREFLVSKLELPCNRPPWGTLAAIDLATGQKVWEVPLGTTRDLFGEKIKIPIAMKWGTPNLGGPIVTRVGLVFVGATMDDYLRAFDVETGAELWKGRLPAGGKATPMTYQLSETGRQFVVIAAGGGLRDPRGDYIVAFALPQ